MKKSLVAALAFALAAGCSGGSHGGGATQSLTLPTWTVQPGTEMLKCVYKSLHNTEDVFVKQFDTTQLPGGHHIVGFLSTTTLADGVEVDCSSAQSMESWRPLLTGLSKEGFTLPSPYAIRIPANATLVFQSHYINTSTAPLQTHDEIKIHFTSKTPDLTEVQTWSNTVLNFNVPAGEVKTFSVDCVAPQDMHVFTMFGHMHEWGKEIRVDLGPTPSSMANIYDIQHWSSSLRDSPPHQVWAFDAPLEVHTGDHVRLACTWDNTQGADALAFPKEMCASVFWFYPGTDSLICTD